MRDMLRALLVAAGLVFAGVAGAAVGLPSVSAGPDGAAAEPRTVSRDTEVRILLSSVDMTLGLLDAYGQCREEGLPHDECMEAIRTTLEHTRGMIGQ